jgi:hypothetical protein
VLVENGGFGAQSAAPIARLVLDYYIAGKLPPGPAAEDEAAVEADEDEDEAPEKPAKPPKTAAGKTAARAGAPKR